MKIKKIAASALIVLTGLIILVSFFYVEEDWRGWHAWHKFAREWEAKGEKFDFASIIPPPVPDDQNFALTPIVYSSYGNYLTRDGKYIPHDKRDPNFVDRLEMPLTPDYSDWPTNIGSWQNATLTDLKPWQNCYRSLAAKTNGFPVAPQPQSPAADILLALSKYDLTIEELRQASQLPYSRFPLNYDDEPAEIIQPYLAALKRCTQVLELRAVAELQNDQSDKSLHDVELSLRLINSIRGEPLLISHLVRLAMLQITLQPVWEGLADHKWSNSQIVEIEQELGGLDFLADYQFALRGERAYANREIDYMRRHRDYREFEEMFNGLTFADDDAFADDETGSSMIFFYLSPALCCYWMPGGWYYQNELAVDQIYQQWFLPMIDANRQLASPKIEGQARAFWVHWKITPQNILPHQFLYYVSGSSIKFAYGQTAVNLARIGCALERYRLAHGEYPKTLDVLAPQFIEKLPHDIIGGLPLHYRRTDDGQFALYSVGWNETDDGGLVGFTKSGELDKNTGDWVWQYPLE